MRRHVCVAGACGLVQVVRLEWDKSARGGQGARNRNAVPVVFEVPADLLPGAGEVVIIESHWSNDNAFSEPFRNRSRRVSVTEKFGFGCVTFAAELEGLSARYQYDRTYGGAPDRWYLNCASGEGNPPGRVLTARFGSWVRLCYNGRFSDNDNGTWWYEQITVNAAWFDGPPSGQVFVSSEPSQEFRALSELS